MLHVVVVESHQHALEHMHHVLRKRRRLEPWSLTHLDAHPDLACPGPSIPAHACFQPRKRLCPAINRDSGESAGGITVKDKDLYDFLDDTVSGIAEWILPLVLAANLTTIRWIPPRNTSILQIPFGIHKYHVGAWSSSRHSTECESFCDLPDDAVVKVDWNCSYYSDDKSVAPVSELMLSKALTLTVDENVGVEGVEDWMLDVCLDYFSCKNPFWIQLEQTSREYADALRSAIYQCPLYKHYASSDPIRLSEFRQAMLRMFEVSRLQLLEEWNVDEIVPFYPSTQQGRELWMSAFRYLPATRIDRVTCLRMSFELVPNLSMPHDAPTLLTRSFIPEFDRIKKQLKEECGSKRPLLVTIARSSTDGFTPSDVVDALQEHTLGVIHEIYCGCSGFHGEGCKVCVTRDYGEWEGQIMEL